MDSIKNMKSRFPQAGKVEWICVRPERANPVQVCNDAIADTEVGLVGDHFSGKPGAERMVTLIQAEHIELMATLLGRDSIDPGLLRRNIVVTGLNLLALKGCQFQIGDAIFEGTTSCPPCSRMEMNLGEGGYNVMVGHGGINAKVIKGGKIQVGDQLTALSRESE